MVRKIIFTIHHAVKWIFLSLILIYRKALSPFLGNHCRFHPSCSQYAIDTIKSHSIFKALLLAGWRILRCHPFNKGGIDPAPHNTR